ncbi:leucine-rich repeat-containing protein 31 isoform X1 [Ornithorhynchus anatinus]|uniref:Leucine rich repeat containing 31 n=2 Tax=Ornithorhynchus anatinus TaxID=9258 RepID=A0A6I8MXC2_ORNAN|nr:leucine-rich repeat-containing protein 31 isoform X1 [Ornithorhynchus anatinus]
MKQTQGQKSSKEREKPRPSFVTKLFGGREEEAKAETGSFGEGIEPGGTGDSPPDVQTAGGQTTAETAEPQPLDSKMESGSNQKKIQQFLQKLGKKFSDRSLNLNNCGLTATDVMELIAMVPFLPDLEELDLSWNEFIGGTLQPLALRIHHIPKLRALRLNNCRLTEEDVAALGNALEATPDLEELNLSWNSSIGGNLLQIFHKFQERSKLQTLKLIDCNLTSEDGKSLGQALLTLQNLEVLDLSMNRNIGSGMKIIARELKNTPGLKVLKLQMCGLTPDSIQVLDSTLGYLPELRKLDLSCNKKVRGGFKESTTHLAKLKHLQVLDLHRCRLSEEDIDSLTQVIPLLTSLRSLNLSANRNPGGSLETLLSRLRFLPELKTVLIHKCALGIESLAALAEASVHLPALETFDLSWNKCLGGNLKLLWETLKLSSALRVLRLRSCNLETEDMSLLASVIQAGHLAKLQTVDLSYNDSISDAGWATLSRAVLVLKELNELDVSLCPSAFRPGGAWFGHLLDGLPRMTMLTQLGIQRWVLPAPQEESLEYFNRDHKRDVHFEYDGFR